MRKYFVRIIAFVVLAAFLLESAALAAGTEAEPELPAAETREEGTEETGELVVTVEYDPVELMDETTIPFENAFLMGDGSWTGTRYRDQLPAEAQNIYDSMEDLFPDRITYGTIKFTSGPLNCVYYEMTLPTVTLTGDALSTLDSKKNEIAVKYNPLAAAVYYAFTYDHPEYFWIRTSGTGSVSIATRSYTSNGVTVKCELEPKLLVAYILPECYHNKTDRDSYSSQINAMVNQILNDCKDLSTVAKLAYFDSWLTEKNNYNNSAAAGTPETIGPAPWNILSGLLDGTSPVCEGYAKSFQLLCHRIGVPCVTVSSRGHMWNAVQVGGKWYYVDVTWNDPSGANYAYSTRNYFLITSFSDDSHSVNQGLAAPPIASSGYFATPGWSLANQAVTGYRDGTSNDCWMALYAAGGKMLEVKPCESIRWGASETRILPPEFSSGTLSQAVSGKTFQVNAWTPSGTADAFTNN